MSKRAHTEAQNHATFLSAPSEVDLSTVSWWRSRGTVVPCTSIGALKFPAANIWAMCWR
jgi:hypothetical protein